MRMRNRLYKCLQKYLHRTGVYTQYYSSEKAIHFHLKSKAVNIQNYELNKICKTLKSAKNHSFYNSLLKMFVPSWCVKISDARFVLGNGIGESSLDCFRSVKIEDNHFFEKVYFSAHDDLKRIEWFSENAYDLINGYGIIAPKIHKVYKGDAFVIVYFEFLDLKPLNNHEIEENFISLVKKLYLASLGTGFITLNANIPEYVKGFKNHFEYKNKIVQANQSLTNHGVSAQRIEQKIIDSKLILTHGDVQEKNAFKNHMLIDFDTFGLYPIGFDVAFFSFRLLTTQKIKNIPSNWLETNFKNDINEENWNDFERNFSYFLFVFLATYFKKESYKSLEKILVERLIQFDS